MKSTPKKNSISHFPGQVTKIYFHVLIEHNNETQFVFLGSGNCEMSMVKVIIVNSKIKVRIIENFNNGVNSKLFHEVTITDLNLSLYEELNPNTC